MPLPLSPLLQEAQPEALQDLFSRDPAGYSLQDLDRVIAEIRAMRDRIALADSQGRKTLPTKAAGPPPNVSPEDLGL